MKIIWTFTAKKSFTKILDYLFENWTNKEIQKFSEETRHILDQIVQNPYMFEASNNKSKVRKGFINELITLFYRIHPRKKEIQLLRFWDNRQNPKKLKLH